MTAWKDDDDVKLVCTPFPVKDRTKHLAMMYPMESVIDRCSACDCKVYLSKAGQDMRASGGYKTFSLICETCAVIDAPEVKVLEGPGTREQLAGAFGDEFADEIISDITGMAIKDWYAEMKERNGDGRPGRDGPDVGDSDAGLRRREGEGVDHPHGLRAPPDGRGVR